VRGGRVAQANMRMGEGLTQDLGGEARVVDAHRNPLLALDAGAYTRHFEAQLEPFLTQRTPKPS
jgi:hypothetical protein